MAQKIQIRRDTAANWTSVNPTLAEGEIGYEKDTGGLKFGDGATAWASLLYAPLRVSTLVALGLATLNSGHIGGVSNYAGFDTSGRFTMNGNARVKNEIRIEAVNAQPGSSAPTDAFRAVGASGNVQMPVKQFVATLQNELYFIFHAPMDLDPTVPVHFHLMWQPATGYTTGNYLWKLEYLVLNENGATLLSGTPTTITANVTPANATTDIETEFAADITLGLNQIMICHFYRDITDTGNASGSVSFFEINYTSGKLGEAL